LEAEGHSAETVPELKELAEAALAVLARNATASENGWLFSTKMSDGLGLEISCSGPELPPSIPALTVFPGDIPKEPDWVGTYRLKIAVPLVAFDISWREDEPLRIMKFSRGDWEAELFAIEGLQ
jgi:hypothetical protein